MSFNVTILGSSSALPTLNRYLTAHLVNHHERFFLIDCGEGTQMQLRRYNTKFTRINNIFISHLHGDHVFGLLGLISSLSMLGRKSDLHIYANQQLQNIIETNIQLFNIELVFKLVFHSFGHKNYETIYDDGKLEVSIIPLKHRIPCVGFIFKEKEKPFNVKKYAIEEYKLSVKNILNAKQGYDVELENGEIIKNSVLTTPPLPIKKYVYCTDTKYTESIVEYIYDADLLYHEATFLNSDIKLAKATYHSTAAQAANLALKAKVKKLVIGHFSSRYKNMELFLNETRSIFENTHLAADGLVYEV